MDEPKPGVTYACYYQTHALCEGLRKRGQTVVGRCMCLCHDTDNHDARTLNG